MCKPDKMAKTKKRRVIIKKPVKIGLKKDGTPKKEYKKGDSASLPEDKIKIYKNNKII